MRLASCITDLDAFGHGVERCIASRIREAVGHIFHNVAARIADGVHRMAKADDHFALGHAAANVLLRFVRGAIALLNLKRHFVGPTVLWTFQRADGASNA